MDNDYLIPPGAKRIEGGWTFGRVIRKSCSGGCGRVFRVAIQTSKVTCGDCVKYKRGQ